MRILLLLALATLPAFAQSESERAARATLDRLFAAMQAHDAEAARPLFAPAARIIAVLADGRLSQMSGDEFSSRLASIQDAIVERIWDVRYSSSGRMVQVWAPYDFHRDGKLHHCGVNSVSVVETEAGWKIAAVVYTTQTEGCPASPLGPLAGPSAK